MHHFDSTRLVGFFHNELFLRFCRSYKSISHFSQTFLACGTSVRAFFQNIASRLHESPLFHFWRVLGPLKSSVKITKISKNHKWDCDLFFLRLVHTRSKKKQKIAWRLHETNYFEFRANCAHALRK